MPMPALAPVDRLPESGLVVPRLELEVILLLLEAVDDIVVLVVEAG
jgi:hypothetical protein